LALGEMGVNLQFRLGKANLTTAHWAEMASLSARSVVLHERAR
jgi:hypothetical protein